jgi:outer membrane receptor protein involved in Fe transport
MVLGRHQLAFGGEYVRSQLNINNLYESNGDFGVSGVYSQKGPAGSSKGGTGADANLDFLTGALNTYQQSKAQQNALRAPIPSLYIQDTYHATKKLVLSAGVRWDPEFVP